MNQQIPMSSLASFVLMLPESEKLGIIEPQLHSCRRHWMSQCHLDVRLEEVKMGTHGNPQVRGSQSPDSRPWHPRGLPLGISHTVPLLNQLAFKSVALEKKQRPKSPH